MFPVVACLAKYKYSDVLLLSGIPALGFWAKHRLNTEHVIGVSFWLR